MSKGLRRSAQLAMVSIGAVAVAMVAAAGAQAATADLGVVKSDSPDPVATGAELTYTITVSNSGPETASAVTLTDKLPKQVDFVSVATSQGACDRSGNKVTCELGPLAGDAYPVGATVTIKLRPKKAGQIVNTASVAVAQGDTDPVSLNNTASETTTVVAPSSGLPKCGGHTATLIGTGAANVLTGSGKRDVIFAGGGRDTIRGLGGRDIVCGGGGKDAIRGGADNDRLKGGGGRDTIRGGRGSDKLRGGRRPDRLFGGGGNDALFGGGGNDRCRGGAGSDTKRSC